uniref:Uncharacterized protein n=1 Tax=viral metagenome TaxID=1070528 RepID=A0A6C0D0N1_9ZZZZ
MAKKLSSWNLFVKKVYKENPGKTFGQCLKIASTLKNQGKMGNAKNMTKSKGKKKGKSRKSRR